jgi:Flp pilus assembly protein TadD
MLARLFHASHRNPIDVKKCQSIMDRAAVEMPTDPAVFLDLANFALADGRNTEAILDAQKALNLVQASSWPESQKKDVRLQGDRIVATARCRRGEWIIAHDELSKLLTENGEDWALHRELARSLFGMGKRDEAERELLRTQASALRLGHSAAPRPIFKMANFYSEIEGDKATKAWFETKCRANPQSWEYHFAYAKWLLEKKDLAAARAHAQKALELQPGDGEIRHFLQSVTDSEKANRPAPRIGS